MLWPSVFACGLLIEMNSKPESDSQSPVRTKLLWSTALLAGLLAMVVVASRFHSNSPPEPAPKETSSISNSSSAPHEASPARVLSHPAPAAASDTDQLIATLFDKSAPVQLRRRAARLLAKLGSDDAMAALRTALTNGSPPYLRVAVAEGLGQCPNPEALPMLHTLVTNQDQTMARGAVRGFALRNDAEAADTLGNLLFNDQTPLSVRTEAALGLGDVNISTAQDFLTNAVAKIHDEDVLESVLDGLGRRPFSETEDFFRSYLNSPDVAPNFKVLAINSLADTEGDVKPFLTNYLHDANASVRSAAASALDFVNSGDNTAP
jgi:HEAT repeat protein